MQKVAQTDEDHPPREAVNEQLSTILAKARALFHRPVRFSWVGLDLLGPVFTWPGFC